MRGLQIMLRSLGISIAQEHIDAIQDLAPRVPGLVSEGVKIVNQCVEKVNAFDTRLRTLENQNREILEHLNGKRRTTTGPGNEPTSN